MFAVENENDLYAEFIRSHFFSLFSCAKLFLFVFSWMDFATLTLIECKCLMVQTDIYTMYPKTMKHLPRISFCDRSMLSPLSLLHSFFVPLAQSPNWTNKKFAWFNSFFLLSFAFSQQQLIRVLVSWKSTYEWKRRKNVHFTSRWQMSVFMVLWDPAQKRQ